VTKTHDSMANWQVVLPSEEMDVRSVGEVDARELAEVVASIYDSQTALDIIIPPRKDETVEATVFKERRHHVTMTDL